MRRKWGIILSLMLCLCIVMPAAGSAQDTWNRIIQFITHQPVSTETDLQPDVQPAPEVQPEPTLQPETEPAPAPQVQPAPELAPENPPATEESFFDPSMGETDGSGIPKDDPVSTTGDTYGYQGAFDLDSASSEKIDLTTGAWTIDDAQLLFWGTVIQNAGTSSLAVHNSYIRGETAVETAPLEGDPGNLLIAGNVRATLGMGNSETIYINSTIASRNWAALSTDAAQPALQDGQKELGLYTYGSEAFAMDGGYGAYSDLLSNLYVFGSHIQAAEIGIISGTYGKVMVGTIGDGEKNTAMLSVLTEQDKSLRSDKELPSIVEGGRNALMIHSVNLPPYWEFEGYSQEELPLLSAKISGKDSTFRTDRALDRNVSYEPQKQAYIDHTAGSVILIKSTNVDMSLDKCSIEPDPAGTGYLVQTVYNNDTMFMNAVPDGQNYPGIHISMNQMEMKGDIAHEDYQRDFLLTLSGSSLEGALNEYDFAHWSQAAAQEGFTLYCPDESYSTHHGLALTLTDGSVWTVTEESHLSRLEISPDSRVNGIILVDGVQQANVPGTTYEGSVVVIPGEGEGAQSQGPAAPGNYTDTSPKSVLQPATQPQTQPAAPEPTAPAAPEPTAPAAPEPTEHVHNWVHEGGSPATCTEDGTYGWVCPDCGAYYLEDMPGTALGHDWVFIDQYPYSCTADGYNVYQCSRCGEITTGDYWPAQGHDWQLTSSIPSTCVSQGQNVYTCANCGEVYYEDLPYSEHDWVYQYSSYVGCETDGYDAYVCANCGIMEYFNYEPAYGHYYQYTGVFDDVYHYYYCAYCGAEYPEIHEFTDPCWCGHSGPVG